MCASQGSEQGHVQRDVTANPQPQSVGANSIASFNQSMKSRQSCNRSFEPVHALRDRLHHLT
jgi:hypothetical protein